MNENRLGEIDPNDHLLVICSYVKVESFEASLSGQSLYGVHVVIINWFLPLQAVSKL